MHRSHVTPPKPSPLLALVCLAMAHRFKPKWVAIPLSEAAALGDLSSERLSRIVSRALTSFDAVLSVLTRLGRPPRDSRRDEAVAQLAVTRAILTVATTILERVQLRGDVTRSLIAGAWLRLREEHPALTQQRFCQALAVPPRTLRDWLKRRASSPTADESPVAKPTKPPKRQRPVRRGRFDFDVTLPGIQTAADTTDLKAFDIPLKLIAAQDVGGRDANLFSSVIVDDHESADLVVDVITEALGGSDGFQVITDQGTPYLAGKTLQAFDELGAEHAPQREGDPLGKATIERAFGTIKQIAEPILNITGRIAKAVPALRDGGLAKASTRLLITSLLRAYQAGARAARRADNARGGIDPATLSRIAEESREQARAHDRSTRMLLTHIHDAYGIDMSLMKFIRTFRRFPLLVLHEAERAFGKQAHRDDIRNRASYFAKIVRACDDADRQRRARQRADRRTQERLERDEHEHQQQHNEGLANPAAWMLRGLESIAGLWQPEHGKLLFGGEIGCAYLRRALAYLIELHGYVPAGHLAAGVIHAFGNDWSGRVGERGVKAVVAVFEREFATMSPKETREEVARRFGAAILRDTGPPTKQRPAPPSDLRT